MSHKDGAQTPTDHQSFGTIPIRQIPVDHTTCSIAYKYADRQDVSLGSVHPRIRHEIIHVIIDIESPQIYEIVHQSETDECDPFIMIESLLHLLLLKQLFTIDYL